MPEPLDHSNLRRPAPRVLRDLVVGRPDRLLRDRPKPADLASMTDPERALTNWWRMLRPGGHLAIIDGLWGQEPDDRMDGIAPSLPLIEPSVAVGDIRALVKRAGFTNVRLSTLDEVDRIERSLRTDEELWQPHYAITGRA